MGFYTLIVDNSNIPFPEINVSKGWYSFGYRSSIGPYPNKWGWHPLLSLLDDISAQ